MILRAAPHDHAACAGESEHAGGRRSGRYSGGGGHVTGKIASRRGRKDGAEIARRNGSEQIRIARWSAMVALYKPERKGRMCGDFETLELILQNGPTYSRRKETATNV